MSLMDAPSYDPTRDERNRKILIGSAVSIVLIVILAIAGFVAGHGWLYTNIPYEHKVSNFFDALEAKDYAKAYGIYNADADWQQHADKYKDYPLKRFTEDWTTQSPVKAPITWHHVDISRADGTGAFGTGVIVAVRINGDHPIFMYVNRKDDTMTWPAIHELRYKYNE
jgi:hypothetical protein